MTLYIVPFNSAYLLKLPSVTGLEAANLVILQESDYDIHLAINQRTYFHPPELRANTNFAVA